MYFIYLLTKRKIVPSVLLRIGVNLFYVILGLFVQNTRPKLMLQIFFRYFFVARCFYRDPPNFRLDGKVCVQKSPCAVEAGIVDPHVISSLFQIDP